MAKATDMVEQLKAIINVASKPEPKKPASHFIGYHPRNYSTTAGRGGWGKSNQGCYQPYQNFNHPGPSMYPRTEELTPVIQTKTLTVTPTACTLYVNKLSCTISSYHCQTKYAKQVVTLNKEGFSDSGACSANQGVHRELVPDNSGPLGSTGNSGISLTSNRTANTVCGTPGIKLTDQADHKRGSRINLQRSSIPGTKHHTIHLIYKKWCMYVFRNFNVFDTHHPQSYWLFTGNSVIEFASLLN